MRTAAVVILVGAALILLGWIGVCVMFIATAPPASRASMVGPNLGVIMIVIMILAPAVLLAIPARKGSRAARWGLTVVGGLYLIGGVGTLVGGELLAIPFIVYSLIWLVLLWSDPGPRAGTGRAH